VRVTLTRTSGLHSHSYSQSRSRSRHARTHVPPRIEIIYPILRRRRPFYSKHPEPLAPIPLRLPFLCSLLIRDHTQILRLEQDRIPRMIRGRKVVEVLLVDHVSFLEQLERPDRVGIRDLPAEEVLRERVDCFGGQRRVVDPRATVERRIESIVRPEDGRAAANMPTSDCEPSMRNPGVVHREIARTYDRIDSSTVLPKLRFNVFCMSMIAWGPTQLQYESRTDFRHHRCRRCRSVSVPPPARTHLDASQK
jgi:hypothetical protein